MKSESSTTKQIKNKYESMWDIFFIIFIILLTVFFSRQVLLPGRLFGDRGDSRLICLIAEHWYKVFCGQERYNNLSMFYPITNTTSYTDMFFMSSIPYSILRACGVGMFPAYKIVLLALHLLGSISLYVLLHKVLGIKNYISFTGVTAFSFSIGYANRMPHTQMTAVSYLPLILIFLILCIKHFQNIKKRRIYLFLFLTIYVLLAYTGWYTFYFSAVFMIIYVVTFLIYGRKCNARILAEIWKQIKGNIKELALWAVYAAMLLIPFLRIYMPTSRLYGPRPWQEICYVSPGLIDIVNVGTNNLMLGKLIRGLDLASKRMKLEGEVAEGFSVFLLAALIYFTVKFFKERPKKSTGKKERNAGIPAERILIGTLIISVAFSVFLIVNIKGYSLWWFVYAILPGASSLKAVARFYLILLIPMGILLAVLLDRYQPPKYPVAFVLTYTLILLFSNISLGGMTAWDYTTDTKLLDSVSAPPEGICVMAIYDSGDEPQEAYLNQLDAWMIADHYGLKTVNGYSGMFPPDWPLWDVTSAEYPYYVEWWKNEHAVEEDIYLYDRNANVWIAP